MSRAFALMAGALSLALAACQTTAPPEVAARAQVEVNEEPRWRGIAAPEDADRVDRAAEAWEQALGQARRAGYGRAMEREGALLAPDGALAMPAPTPGPYRCRLIRFAPARPRGAVLTTFRPFFCYVGVDGDALSIIKQTGSERPSGYLWADRVPTRLIFLGSMGDDPRDPLIPYGADRQRDMAALFERVGEFRFRLVVPWPRSGAILDVYELVPNVQTN